MKARLAWWLHWASLHAWLIAALFCGCAHVEPVHGPHWWNCTNRECGSDMRVSRVLSASYDRQRHACECYAEDRRHLPQWIEVKP